ncbi:Holliday junction resolvase RuvX [Patescibacteria group bacterium]|nr:Holliday junction resolvase RuvX [Patescibacteria group bacterium]
MGRIVALDYGTKRVGIAVTDPSAIIATPLETIHSKDILEFLKIYDDKENIDSFVVGLPKKLNNKDTHATKPVRMFVRQLGKKFPGKKIHLCDERFTSKIAQQAMLEGGMKKKDRQNKANVDKISATIILQSYLESRAHGA